MMLIIFSVCLFAIFICISGELSQLFCTFKIEFFFLLMNIKVFFMFAEYKLFILYVIWKYPPSL